MPCCSLAALMKTTIIVLKLQHFFMEVFCWNKGDIFNILQKLVCALCLPLSSLQVSDFYEISFIVLVCAFVVNPGGRFA